MDTPFPYTTLFRSAMGAEHPCQTIRQQDQAQSCGPGLAEHKLIETILRDDVEYSIESREM